VGTETSPTAKARLVFDNKTGKALLFVENLPDAPKGKTYQVWFISDPTKPTPGHTFETGANGKAELRDQIPANSLNSTIFAVTLEPVGGSAAPTGEKYLLGHSL
jgi:anti-sigma-K factor RskA